MFKVDDYVKIVDTSGNYRFGFISDTKDRGSFLLIDLNEEGLSKINYDNEFVKNNGHAQILAKDFGNLLTETEWHVVPLLAECLTTKEIAARMNISPSTVRAHIRDLKIKLQLQTREQLFVYCQGIAKLR